MSELYQVVAPLVLVKDGAGAVHYAYQDALVRLCDEQADHFLAEGLVVVVDAPVVEEVGSGKPAANAKKDALVAWALANIAKDDGSDYTEGELNDLKVAELRSLIDSVED